MPTSASAFRASITPQAMALARVKVPGPLWIILKPVIEKLVLALVDLILARLVPAGGAVALTMDYTPDPAVAGVLLLHPSGEMGEDCAPMGCPCAGAPPDAGPDAVRPNTDPDVGFPEIHPPL